MKLLKIKKNLQTEILFFSICISLLPTLSIFFVTMQNYKQVYISQIESTTSTVIKNTTESISENLKNISSLETALLFSQYENHSVFLSICDQESAYSHPSPLERLQNNRAFEYVCTNLLGNNTFAEGVYLFTNSGYTYSYMKNNEFWLGDSQPDTGWRKELDEKGGGNMILPFTPKHREDGSRYLLFAEKFKNLNGKSTGTVAVVCNLSVLEQRASGNFSEGGVYILLPDKMLLSGVGGHESLSLTGDQIAKIQNRESGYLESDDKEDVVVFGTLANLNWKVISKVSLQPFYSAYLKNRNFLFSLLTAVVFLILFLVYEMEKIFARPLVRLSQIMNTTGNFETIRFRNPCDRRKDEIGVLYRCFEQMLNRLHQLIEERYKSEIRYLRSRLRNLNSQINAHFLFNTLEAINDFAVIENNRKIAQMSKLLGDLLRYSVDFETDEVPLREELDSVRKYVGIQEIKFGRPIEFSVLLEEGLSEHKVMKFFLQPIVENAIEHGMPEEADRGGGKITLRAFAAGGDLHITILNDGALIPEAKLKKIDEFLASGRERSRNRSGGIGLSNINKRLKLLYSDHYGLSVRNMEDGGVLVEVLMPD